MNQREIFLRKQLQAVRAEQHGAIVLVEELSSTWWGRLALRLALRRIERDG
jgi:hypothetical protein